MNITFLMQDTGAVYGAERATCDLMVGLASRGERVHALLIREERLRQTSTDLQKSLEDSGIPFDLIPTRAAFSCALVQRIRRRLRTLKADVLHTVGYKANVHGLLAAKRGRLCPVVAVVHGWLRRPDLKERFYGQVDIRALRRCSRVIALSRYYEQLLSTRGVREGSVVRIPSGIDPGKKVSVSEAGASFSREGPYVFGMMGRLSWEKNHSMLLEAAAELVEAGADVRLVIAGEGPERASIESAIRRKALTGCVEMVGYVDTDDFLRKINALILCSRIENLPYIVLEAMCWCRPVIATNVGGLPDLVVDGETGYLVPSDNARELCRRMQALASDRDGSLKFGLGGRAKLEKEFSYMACIDEYMRVYGEMVRR